MPRRVRTSFGLGDAQADAQLVEHAALHATQVGQTGQVFQALQQAFFFRAVRHHPPVGSRVGQQRIAPAHAGAGRAFGSDGNGGGRFIVCVGRLRIFIQPGPVSTRECTHDAIRPPGPVAPVTEQPLPGGALILGNDMPIVVFNQKAGWANPPSPATWPPSAQPKACARW